MRVKKNNEVNETIINRLSIRILEGIKSMIRDYDFLYNNEELDLLKRMLSKISSTQSIEVINEIENQLNIFLENKNIIDGYFFDYLHFKTGLIELSSGFYINRKLMEYLIYCMEHYHLAIDNYIPEHLLYPNDCNNIFYDYLYKFDGYVTEHIDIPSEILPIQIMLSPKLLCIQPDKVDQYLGKLDHIKQKSIQDSNEYNLI